MLMQDEAGKDISPSIPAIDTAADELQKDKARLADGLKKLKEKVIASYDNLDLILAAHKEAMGAMLQYTYTNYQDKRKTVKLGKRRITIKAAKAERGAKKSQRAGNEINPK